MHPRGSSLSCCLRSAVQLGIRIIPPCEQRQCVWRLDAILETARLVQTDLEGIWSSRSGETGAQWDLWSSESHRHVLLVQLQLAACTPAGHPRFAGHLPQDLDGFSRLEGSELCLDMLDIELDI